MLCHQRMNSTNIRAIFTQSNERVGEHPLLTAANKTTFLAKNCNTQSNSVQELQITFGGKVS